MANFAKTSIDFSKARTELHDTLKLTGAEISYNTLPAGVEIPFVHSHKENEEIYLFIEGDGKFYADGEIVEIKKGDALRVDPACARCIKAGTLGLSYFCVQVKSGSLEHFTMSDGVISETKAQL